MTHGTEHHLEHAEHTEHASHNPFDKQVALSMAIIAAVLAVVSMLSHKAHNGTLLYQSESTTYKTEASNQWNYFQSKKQRGYAKEDFFEAARYSEILTKGTATISTAKKKKSKDKAEKGNKKQITADLKAEKTRLKNKPKDPAKLPEYWRDLAALYLRESQLIEDKAREFEDLAKKKKEQSDHEHHVAQRLDLGHLGLELALVLCAIAMLSKQKGFWLTALGIGLVGTLVSFSAYLL